MKTEPAIGDTWVRRDGKTQPFKIVRMDSTDVFYWLSHGSRPRMCSISRKNLGRYKRVLPR